jgi:hypothetical protein
VGTYDGNKKIKGRKCLIMVDTLGNLLKVVVTADKGYQAICRLGL